MYHFKSTCAPAAHEMMNCHHYHALPSQLDHHITLHTFLRVPLIYLGVLFTGFGIISSYRRNIPPSQREKIKRKTSLKNPAGLEQRASFILSFFCLCSLSHWHLQCIRCGIAESEHPQPWRLPLINPLHSLRSGNKCGSIVEDKILNAAGFGQADKRGRLWKEMLMGSVWAESLTGYLLQLLWGSSSYLE